MKKSLAQGMRADKERGDFSKADGTATDTVCDLDDGKDVYFSVCFLWEVRAARYARRERRRHNQRVLMQLERRTKIYGGTLRRLYGELALTSRRDDSYPYIAGLVFINLNTAFAI